MSNSEVMSGSQSIPRIPYSVVRVLLDDARTTELILNHQGADFLSCIDLVTPTAASVSIRLNYADAAPIPMESGRSVVCPPEFLRTMYSARAVHLPPPIKRIYMTNDACAGGYVDLGIGGDASFQLVSSGTVVVVGMSTMIALLGTLISTTSSELQRAITGVDLSAALASTSTPLNAGTSWTSGWVSVDRYAILVATVYADQNCDLIVQQSWDGTDVDAEDDCDPIIANAPTGIVPFQVVAPYARWRLTNSSLNNMSTLRVRCAGRAL